MDNTEDTQEFTLDPTKPLAFTIYKGITGKFGAVRFEMMKPFSNPKRKKQDGAILVSAANASAANTYDWDNKIKFALSITDIGQFLEGLKKGEISIIHDPGMKSDTQGQVIKSLKMNKPEGKDNFFFSLTEKNNGKQTEVKLPISMQEAIVLNTLLTYALPRLLNW